MRHLTTVVVLALLLTACGSPSQDDAIAVAKVLNATQADFTTVTAEPNGSVAVETTLYPKSDNEPFAAQVCGPIILAKRNGDLPTINSARIRASDGSTLAYCNLP